MNSQEIADRLDWIVKEEDLSENLSLRTVETIRTAAKLLREIDEALSRASAEGWDERNRIIHKMAEARIAELEREVKRLSP